MQEFERVRLDVAGQGVLITSWYEIEKQRWRANAPALLHLMHEEFGSNETVIVGSTRLQAIRSLCDFLTKRVNRR
ncbi:MAG: hypothetical protein OHK0029_38910 [Armatimonadaceae bacterium]